MSPFLDVSAWLSRGDPNRVILGHGYGDFVQEWIFPARSPDADSEVSSPSPAMATYRGSEPHRRAAYGKGKVAIVTGAARGLGRA